MILKDEDGREPKSKEEVVLAFRRKLERTFKISEMENDEFNPETEGGGGMVEREGNSTEEQKKSSDGEYSSHYC